ncbi:molybdenum cofactor guanylyltransferase [Microbacterium album]|uniref:Probable molybdenum cofactor guanylyltransferase n=1 Tax=Microbacterium album TaxID=2053191 RepID=A0A917IFU9_9MICO|nr:NTP transferase domain-containing protein [Microbacterium album]GGH46296.1 molybdenum cofactor guanylyltransferase [Microbacterium album]
MSAAPRPVRGIVLAGGRSSRLGGRHKPALEVGGRPIVARVIEALRGVGADPLVVGLPEAVPDGVPVVREDPPYAGPLAALAAGMGALRPHAEGVIVVLGGDMPFVTAGLLRGLIDSAGRGAAFAEDESGRLQPLCAAWDEAVLRQRLARLGETADRPLRALFADLDPVRVAAPGRELRDIDTPEDLAAAGE